MNITSVFRSLSIVVKHFADSYAVEFKNLLSGKKTFYTPESIAERSSYKQRGVFTVQYPEEKLPVPEEFRFIPFLVYEEGENGEKNMRCTSCGICAKVCPPQCIWIQRTTDPVTGRPVPSPAEFYIDTDICMNCGYCAEYCPFDAIKMDHDYEIANYNRMRESVYDLQKLAKPVSYYAKIRPTNYAREEAARQADKDAKAAKKAGAAAGD